MLSIGKTLHFNEASRDRMFITRLSWELLLFSAESDHLAQSRLLKTIPSFCPELDKVYKNMLTVFFRVNDDMFRCNVVSALPTASAEENEGNL